MSLRDLQRQQAESRRKQKREQEIRESVTQWLQTFCNDGLPQILELAKSELKQNGLGTETSMYRGGEDSPSFSGEIRITGTHAAGCIFGFEYFMVEGYGLNWGTSTFYDEPLFSISMSSAERMVVPVFVVEKTRGLYIPGSYGFFWKGPEDNVRIAKALVAAAIGRRIKGEFTPHRADKCVIASTVYGETAPEVAVLRQFRDRVLAKSTIGIHLIRLYYRVAPRAAPYIRRHQGTKLALRAILKTIVVFAKVALANWGLRHILGVHTEKHIRKWESE